MIMQHNGKHSSMSGNSPFSRRKLAEDIILNSKGEAVEEQLRGTYNMDNNGINKMHASRDMNNFIVVLKIPTSSKIGKPIIKIEAEITV